LENITKAKSREKADINGSQVNGMKASGLKGKSKDLVNGWVQIRIIMLENGLIINLMDLVNMFGIMEIFMKVNGKCACGMVKDVISLP